jgi:hypothetical protein
MEAILCFEAWLEEPMYWEICNRCGKAAMLGDAIAALMRLIVKHLTRDGSNGWKVSKRHQIKHTDCLIITFGAPCCYNVPVPRSTTRLTSSVLGNKYRRIQIQLTSSMVAELPTQSSSPPCMIFSKHVKYYLSFHSTTVGIK